ncbi:MAG: co-chaperone GroES [bacterium]|nr:co-chaperone GroES [bacterium]
MIIKPLSDRVLLEPLKEEQKTKTGILLPETVEQEKSEQGTVIAVGPGKKGKDGKITPLDVKVGDIVLYAKYGPNEMKVEGKDYLIAEEKDILAILE